MNNNNNKGRYVPYPRVSGIPQRSGQHYAKSVSEQPDWARPTETLYGHFTSCRQVQHYESTYSISIADVLLGEGLTIDDRLHTIGNSDSALR